MTTKKCQITLEENVIARLEAEGGGTGAKYQAKGIEVLILKLDILAPRQAAKEKTLDLPDEDLTPKRDGRTLRGEQTQAEKSTKAETEQQAKRRKAQLYNLREHGLESAGPRLPGISDKDWNEALETGIRETAEYLANRDNPIVQNLKLTSAALKAFGWDTTPADMPDEAIADANAMYTQKKEPTLSELWAANPIEIPDDGEEVTEI